jgi:hypothetical protein
LEAKRNNLLEITKSIAGNERVMESTEFANSFLIKRGGGNFQPHILVNFFTNRITLRSSGYAGEALRLGEAYEEMYGKVYYNKRLSR